MAKVEQINPVPYPTVSDPRLHELSGPFEIFEVPPDSDAWIHPLRVEVGKMLIHPRYRPEGKWIVVLRVHVPAGRGQGEKDSYPFRWDVTAQTLCAQIWMRLTPVVPAGSTVEDVLAEAAAKQAFPEFEPPQEMWHVVKHGRAPSARFTLEVHPLES